MRLGETELPGVFVLETERNEDDRGWFMRVFEETVLAEAGLAARFPQHSIASNRLSGTIRGLHYQEAPHAEHKIVRVLRGALFDVAVDLRPASPTFGRWTGVRLDEASGTALYIPAGFAHGYQTLQDDTEALYLISEPYVAELARGVNYADPSLGINWPLPISNVSARDQALPFLPYGSNASTSDGRNEN